MKNIFIVDDHPLVRCGYAFLIEREPDLVLCGEARSASEALDLIPTARPDLVVTDLTLDGMNGLELIKCLQMQRPKLPVLVVSMHDELLYAERALRAGARGYIMKDHLDCTIIEAIRQVLQGGFYVSERIHERILLQYQGRLAPEERSAVHPLTDRELEVFEAYGRGLSTRQVAEILHISPKTVETHRGRIKTKLALDSSAEMLQRAMHWVQHQDTL